MDSLDSRYSSRMRRINSATGMPVLLASLPSRSSCRSVRNKLVRFIIPIICLTGIHCQGLGGACTENGQVARNRHGQPNGLDRLDSDKGYDPDSCVPCCWPCNRKKSNTGYEDFIIRCQKITNCGIGLLGRALIFTIPMTYYLAVDHHFPLTNRQNRTVMFQNRPFYEHVAQ